MLSRPPFVNAQSAQPYCSLACKLPGIGGDSYGIASWVDNQLATTYPPPGSHSIVTVSRLPSKSQVLSEGMAGLTFKHLQRWLFAFFVLAAWTNQAQAAEFIVTTRVFVKDQPKPIAIHTTYFAKSAVVDKAQGNAGPHTVTILHRATGELVIVDPTRNVTCHIPSDELIRTVAAISSRTADKPAIVQFAADPDFKITAQPNTSKTNRRIQFEGEVLSYETQVEIPEKPSAERDYQAFADAAARLNATRVGGLPPAARIAINRHIAAAGCVPIRVECQRPDCEDIIYTTHEFQWEFDDKAQQVVNDTMKLAQTLPIVNLSQLRLAQNQPSIPRKQ